MLHQLMELPSDQFERLMGQLVKRMGYETQAIRYGRDGSVYFATTRRDASPTYPFLIQFKRRATALGIGTVRKLYGVLEAVREPTSAVLVATGDFSDDARAYAERKDIELIDGARLEQLLVEYNLARYLDAAPGAGSREN